VLKSAEHRNNGASNAHLWTLSTGKLSKTADWLTQKDEQTQNEIIWRSLRARKESKITRDSKKRNEVLKFLRFPDNAGECILQKPCEVINIKPINAVIISLTNASKKNSKKIFQKIFQNFFSKIFSKNFFRKFFHGTKQSFLCF
jgi:hypothetical protein